MKRLWSVVAFVLLGFSLSAQLPFDTLTPIKEMRVYFAFGKAELPDSARNGLAGAISELDPTLHWVEVLAHTDSIGTSRANAQLANRRAQTVASFLIDTLDWPDRRIRRSGLGEGQPVASNADETGRQANRRATVTVFQRRPLVQLAGQVIDDSTGLGVRAEIHLRAKTWRDSLWTDSLGSWTYPVPAGEVMGVEIYAPGHFYTSQMLKALPGRTPQIESRVRPFQPGAIADIENLYFVGNQAVLLPKSEPELPKLLRFMQVNPMLRVEIAGHVNLPFNPPRDTSTFHYHLSLDRAKMVYDFLIEHGIPAERMLYKGYSNWDMRFPFATNERQQALNRRVEIRVLSTGETISRKEPLHPEKGR